MKAKKEQPKDIYVPMAIVEKIKEKERDTAFIVKARAKQHKRELSGHYVNIGDKHNTQILISKNQNKDERVKKFLDSRENSMAW